jgi:predicted nuclease of predicted toxin-antitoxin system
VKWLLDNGVPYGAARLLNDEGESAVHVRDLGMSSAEDADILEHAQNSGYVVVTFDADFHTLLALRGAEYPSVVRIRREGLKSVDVLRLVLELILRRSWSAVRR